MTAPAWFQNTVGDWSRSIQAGVILLCAISVIGVGYGVFIQKEVKQHEALLMNEKKLRQMIEFSHQESKTLEQDLKYKPPFDAMRNPFPTAHHMSSLLNSIVAMGEAQRLSFDLISPLPNRSHDSYMESPILLVVRGSFSNALNGLKHWTDLNAFMTWEDMSLSPLQSDATGELLQMKVKVRIYWRSKNGNGALKPRQSRVSPFNPFKQNLHSLNESSIDAMQLVGVFSDGTGSVALIKSPEGRIDAVKTGDRIGRSQAHVLRVDSDQVGIEEAVQTGKGILNKLITLHL